MAVVGGEARAALQERNYIDCIVVVHERGLVDEVGGFDDDLAVADGEVEVQPPHQRQDALPQSEILVKHCSS